MSVGWKTSDNQNNSTKTKFPYRILSEVAHISESRTTALLISLKGKKWG